MTRYHSSRVSNWADGPEAAGAARGHPSVRPRCSAPARVGTSTIVSCVVEDRRACTRLEIAAWKLPRVAVRMRRVRRGVTKGLH